MKSSTNQSLNRDDDKEKLKLHHGGHFVDNQGRGRGAFKKQSFLNPQQSPLRAYRVEDNFTRTEAPDPDIFEASVNPG